MPVSAERLALPTMMPAQAQKHADLPCVFHPTATGVRWPFTPFGAG
jgi:hypothetical protein